MRAYGTIQVAKLKLCQYLLRAILTNLIVAKLSRYTVHAFRLHEFSLCKLILIGLVQTSEFVMDYCIW